MKFNEIIRLALKEAGITQTELGGKLGIRPNAVSNIVARPSINLNTFLKIMDILGYDVIVRSRNDNKIITIEPESHLE